MLNIAVIGVLWIANSIIIAMILRWGIIKMMGRQLANETESVLAYVAEGEPE